ncbi:hypothetical protein [Bifidobacterium tibiigranuli]|jgi:hypothetical protein|uniref:hypothetical protein n=1 Tax=Bifidobacterium tibiigranuli TaxID=2172043 RepID=UPI0026EF8AB3|nr:hypothetical protein [Bifidobacterium tibiigranuli]MCI1649248.1 hypothetical protein [Bifidobacterium tibiigranuli]MCI2185817.1 hypothetical protein [Bifidobacterium tibiigranuli]MCI2203128.1 hypothetical protein [Bifidobacterium tibiigranuli]
MTVLTFDDVKYAKAEAEARRRGVDLRAKLSHEVETYAHDAEVRNSEFSDDDEIAGVLRTHEDVRRFFEGILSEAAAGD